MIAEVVNLIERTKLIQEYLSVNFSETCQQVLKSGAIVQSIRCSM